MNEKFRLEKAKEWLSAMADKGMYSVNAARLRVTAIDQLTSVLGPDEANDVEAVLANVEDLARRWTTKNNGNPETGQTYRQRAKNGLEAYLEFQKDPANFKPPAVRVVAPEGNRKPSEKKAAAVPPVAEEQRGAPPSTSALSYPLGEGRTFQYGLPENGLVMTDVVRIACHLLTLAKDWNPMAETPAQIVAIAKAAAANERF